MIQTTNKYSKETFIRLNYWYDRIHGLVQEDIDKVNTMVEHIEKTRSDRYPRTGDNLFFVSGYGERSRLFFIDAVYGDNIILRDFSRVPFVSRDKVWGIERSGFFNGREKWAKGFENQRV